MDLKTWLLLAEGLLIFILFFKIWSLRADLENHASFHAKPNVMDEVAALEKRIEEKISFEIEETQTSGGGMSTYVPLQRPTMGLKLYMSCIESKIQRAFDCIEKLEENHYKLCDHLGVEMKTIPGTPTRAEYVKIKPQKGTAK